MASQPTIDLSKLKDYNNIKTYFVKGSLTINGNSFTFNHITKYTVPVHSISGFTFLNIKKNTYSHYYNISYYDLNSVITQVDHGIQLNENETDDKTVEITEKIQPLPTVNVAITSTSGGQKKYKHPNGMTYVVKRGPLGGDYYVKDGKKVYRH